MPKPTLALYRLFLYALLPAVLARLAWRGRRAPAYRRRWGERFGFVDRPHGPSPIWVHAVSVGETQAALPLIRRLQATYPSIPVLVTTTTPTGSALVRKALGDTVLHCYLPYDLNGAVRRFLRRMRPRLAVVMETELWPNLFHHLHCRRIPIILANARLSARSARRYDRFRPLMADTLDCIDTIAAQAPADAERFLALGAVAERVEVAGNMKFDLAISDQERDAGAAVRQALGKERPVWIAASTHEGEEEQVLAAFAEVRSRLPDAALILVPRHPERFGRVESLCRETGFRVAARSRESLPAKPTDIYLGDTMGDLVTLYAAADVAFVGGSLVPAGGHNPVEPAAFGLPVLSGPQVFNFQSVMEPMVQARGLRLVADGKELAAAVIGLFSDRRHRRQTGARARRLYESNSGAVARLSALIEQRLMPAAGEPAVRRDDCRRRGRPLTAETVRY